MVDCSTIEEGMYAAELGFDLVGTTMSGSTEYTQGKNTGFGNDKGVRREQG